MIKRLQSNDKHNQMIYRGSHTYTVFKMNACICMFEWLVERL